MGQHVNIIAIYRRRRYYRAFPGPTATRCCSYCTTPAVLCNISVNALFFFIKAKQFLFGYLLHGCILNVFCIFSCAPGSREKIVLRQLILSGVNCSPAE